MFISRMPLNVGRSQALRLLGSPYRVHAAVEHSFPPDSARRSALCRESRAARLFPPNQPGRLVNNECMGDEGLLSCHLAYQRGSDLAV